MDEGTGLRSDDKSDDESEISAGPQLEPRRPHAEDTATAADTTNKPKDSVQAESNATAWPLGGVQGLAESQLEQQPFVVSYPGQRVAGGDLPVGAMTRAQDCCQSAHANTLYGVEIVQDDL